MGTQYRVELLLCYGNHEWARGKDADIAASFDDAEPRGGGDVLVTYEVSPDARGNGITNEMEAYRLARNRLEARIEAEGWDARVGNADIEPVERERESLEDVTIDEVDNWVETDDDDWTGWTHEPTDHYLAIMEDGPDVSERWHSDRWCEERPWVLSHSFTTIGRYETEAEARESALKWMYGEPYSLDPANSYM